MITNYGDQVRVRRAGNPLEVDDVIVEQLLEGEWTKVLAYNSLSSDTAYTDARGFAQRLQKRLPAANPS
ncbi:MAG: hypothetical protein EOP35_06110 [Rubrivivax sp.]|nr:MAG: hypothetical protein EOP35_06110 [Rubrivivax sp.]